MYAKQEIKDNKSKKIPKGIFCFTSKPALLPKAVCA